MRLELEWEYTPERLFEEPFVHKLGPWTVQVELGQIVAFMEILEENSRPEQRLLVETFVKGLFLGSQVVEYSEWTLTRPKVSVLRDDGSRSFYLEIQSAVHQVRAGRVDLIMTCADGTVVDSRRTRVEKKRRLGLSVAALLGTDQALERMLRSHRAAILDPEDELIHLYEIRESIDSRFGGKGPAIRSLRLLDTDWRRLGELCNSLPLSEGRHRGRFGDQVRKATPAELEEARGLASKFLEAYIVYLGDSYTSSSQADLVQTTVRNDD